MFLSGARADDRSPWGDFWFTPIGSRSAAGQRVNADSAMTLAAVYACVRVLSESFAVLPFQLTRPKVGGGKTKVTDHWLYRLFAKRPNRWQTPFMWREMLQGHLALRGNAFCQIVDDGHGGISELMPLHPDRMRIEMLPSGDYRYKYKGQNGTETMFRRDQIWHIRGLSGDGIIGLSPLDLARETFGESLAMQAYSSQFYQNDATPGGGWIEFPGKFADAAAKQSFRESWKKLQGGANRGETAVLDLGMKYHELGVNNRDAQFIEGRNLKTSEIARIFRVPPHKIGDLSKATFSNIEQQSIEFWTDTMLPWGERWESSIECDLLGEDTDLEVEFDFRRQMRGDSVARAEYLNKMVLTGIFSRNEAREEEGRDPAKGLDEFLVPVNERNASDPDPNQEAGPDEELPDAPPTGGDEDANARLAVVVKANAARLARRFAKADLSNMGADLLAEAIAVDAAVAADWIGANASAEFTESSLRDALVTLGGY